MFVSLAYDSYGMSHRGERTWIHERYSVMSFILLISCQIVGEKIATRHGWLKLCKRSAWWRDKLSTITETYVNHVINGTKFVRIGPSDESWSPFNLKVGIFWERLVHKVLLSYRLFAFERNSDSCQSENQGQLICPDYLWSCLPWGISKFDIFDIVVVHQQEINCNRCCQICKDILFHWWLFVGRNLCILHNFLCAIKELADFTWFANQLFVSKFWNHKLRSTLVYKIGR